MEFRYEFRNSALCWAMHPKQPDSMDIRQATRAYETWLREALPVLDGDLQLKHRRMAESAFAFLRATFYRWVQLWPQVCPEIATATTVLGVGDLHAENFGTWRDCEGRLIWGVNDFDEVWEIPYTNDLVRLAASVRLAIRENHLSCDPTDACDAILAGYQSAITAGGAPFVLAEQHHWLRDLAFSELRDPVAYWQKLDRWPTVRAGISPEVRDAINRALPERGLPYRVVHRQAGLGSLGRRRFTALADWRGGRIAREAKELRLSAWVWEKSSRGPGQIKYGRMLDQAVRVADPFVGIRGRWLVRRLAPDCSRVELASLPKSRDVLKFVKAMGWETANTHLGTKGAARRVREDLKKRPAKWLRRASEAMSKATLDDWKVWAKSEPTKKSL
jgi:hypothetical protein